MKKAFKKILWGLGTVAAILIIFVAWYGIKASSELKKLTPIETGQLTDSIFTIKDSFANVFLVKNGNKYIVIDGGNSIDGIKAGLVKLNINPDSVAAILLTHSDGDHINAIGVFPKATIYMSKQEEQMINGETPRFLFVKNGKFERPYNVVEDNQVLELLDYKIQGILVPGHTPGSMCYLINDKYLFTGDALSLKDGKIARFNQFFNMDSETAAKSMEKLRNYPKVQYVFTAHHGISSDYKNAVSQ